MITTSYRIETLAADILTFLLRSFVALLVLYVLYSIGVTAFYRVVSSPLDAAGEYILTEARQHFYQVSINELVGSILLWFLSRPVAVLIAKYSFTKDDSTA